MCYKAVPRKRRKARGCVGDGWGCRDAIEPRNTLLPTQTTVYCVPTYLCGCVAVPWKVQRVRSKMLRVPLCL